VGDKGGKVGRSEGREKVEGRREKGEVLS